MSLYGLTIMACVTNCGIYDLTYGNKILILPQDKCEYLGYS